MHGETVKLIPIKPSSRTVLRFVSFSDKYLKCATLRI